MSTADPIIQVIRRGKRFRRELGELDNVGRALRSDHGDDDSKPRWTDRVGMPASPPQQNLQQIIETGPVRRGRTPDGV